MLIAGIIVYSAFAYLAVGASFAVWFVIFGVSKIDASAAESGLGFRFVIFFGAAVFWIFLAWRLAKHKEGPLEKNADRERSKSVS